MNMPSVECWLNSTATSTITGMDKTIPVHLPLANFGRYPKATRPTTEPGGPFCVHSCSRSKVRELSSHI